MRTKFYMARFIYIIAMSSVGVYTIPVVLAGNNPEFVAGPAPAPNLAAFRYLLLGIAVLMFFLIKYLRNLILSVKIRPGAVGTDAAATRLLIADILTPVLCESIAISGLLLFFLGRRTDDYYTLLILSLIYFLYFFPRFSQWEERLPENGPKGYAPKSPG